MASTYHFDLSMYPPGTAFTFHKSGKVYPILTHDKATRSLARDSHPQLAACPADQLTHYVTGVEPATGVLIQSVKSQVWVDGPGGPLSQQYNKLVSYAISIPGGEESPLNNNNTLACALLFLHNNLMNLDSTNNFQIPLTIYNIINQVAGDLVQALVNLQMSGNSWISDPYPVMTGKENMVYPDFYYEKNPSDSTSPIKINCDTGSTNPACKLSGQWVYSQKLNADALQPALGSCLAKAIRATKNVPELQGKTWNIQKAILSSTYNAKQDLSDAALQGRAVSSLGSSQMAEATPGDGSVKWTLNNLSPGSGLSVTGYEVNMNTDTDSPGYAGQLKVTCLNSWLRHLSAYVQFLKFQGQGTSQTLVPISLGSSSDATLNPNWPGPDPSHPPPQYFYSNKTWKGDFVNKPMVGNSGPSIGDLGSDTGFLEPGDFKKLLAWVNPTGTICGVPVPNDPTTLTIDYLPKDADVIRVMWGGLGRGPYDQEVCALGISLTAIFELALPMILLMYDAATVDSEALTETVWNHKGTMLNLAETIVTVVMNTGLNASTMVQQDAEAIGKFLAESLLPDLLQTGCAYGAILLAQIGVGEAMEAIPFVDIASVIFNSIITVAQLSQTIVEVLDSPFVFTTDISRSFDLTLTMAPDADMHEFPPEAIGGTYRVCIAFSNNGTPAVFDYTMSPTTQTEPIVINFSDLPAGGNIQVTVFMYSQTGWQAGQGQSIWTEARGDGTPPSPTTKNISITVKNNPPPLDQFTQYQFTEKTVYQNDCRAWWGANSSPAATQPIATRQDNTGITELNGLTICQDAGMLGYTFQTNAKQFTVQNISLLQDPQSAYANLNGIVVMPGLAYQRKCAEDGSGLNFYLDTNTKTNPGSECHLRHLQLVYDPETFKSLPPDMNPDPALSWGSFPFPMDRLATYGNYVAGISFDALNHSKIYIVALPASGLPLNEAPKAYMISGRGTRVGLISIPRAITFGMQGQILVLEMGADVDGVKGAGPRIQSFDTNGSVYECFDPMGTGKKQAFMPIKCTPETTLLDLAVEPLGYVYVLSYEGEGSSPTDYNLDLYKPDGSWLARTNGFAAANITVDIIRDVYALNYEALQGTSDPEPSLSLWIPPVKPYTGTVNSLNGNTIMVLQPDNLLTVITNTDTVIMINGQKGTLSQISTGQTIRVYGCMDSKGTLTATQVFVPDNQ